MNHKDSCRTAPVTPGLLKTFHLTDVKYIDNTLVVEEYGGLLCID